MANLNELLIVSSRTVRTTRLFLGMLSIIIVHPFLQRFFVKGIVLGTVKG